VSVSRRVKYTYAAKSRHQLRHARYWPTRRAGGEGEKAACGPADNAGQGNAVGSGGESRVSTSSCQPVARRRARSTGVAMSRATFGPALQLGGTTGSG
jgi:hypothetical protein